MSNYVVRKELDSVLVTSPPEGAAVYWDLSSDFSSLSAISSHQTLIFLVYLNNLWANLDVAGVRPMRLPIGPASPLRADFFIEPWLFNKLILYADFNLF